MEEIEKHRVGCKKQEKIEKVTSSPNEQKIKSIESISIFSVHFTLNLPQASRLLGMTILWDNKSRFHDRIVIPTGA
jgi:hypothetical protein